MEGRQTSVPQRESAAVLFMTVWGRAEVGATKGRETREGFSEEVTPELGLSQ